MQIQQTIRAFISIKHLKRESQPTSSTKPEKAMMEKKRLFFVFYFDCDSVQKSLLVTNLIATNNNNSLHIIKCCLICKIDPLCYYKILTESKSNQ
jgi:hypothetical protein